jgi:hypothetical protein
MRPPRIAQRQDAEVSNQKRRFGLTRGGCIENSKLKTQNSKHKTGRKRRGCDEGCIG